MGVDVSRRSETLRREREALLRREIKEELPKLKVGKLKLWKNVRSENEYSGRKMSDAIFLAEKVTGDLVIGDEIELDGAGWYKPRGIRLTPTSRYVRNKLFPRRRKAKSNRGQRSRVNKR